MNTAMYERQRIYNWTGRNRENEMWTGSLEGIYWDCLYFYVWFDSLCVGIAYKTNSHRKGQKMSVSDSIVLIWQAFREKVVFCVKGVGRKALKFSVKKSQDKFLFCKPNAELHCSRYRNCFPQDIKTWWYRYWQGIKSFLKALFNAYNTPITKHFVLQKPNLPTLILKCVFSWVFACTGRLLWGFRLDNKTQRNDVE